MHIWYGIKGTVDRKLSASLEELKAKGYPFSCTVFEDLQQYRQSWGTVLKTDPVMIYPAHGKPFQTGDLK